MSPNFQFILQKTEKIFEKEIENVKKMDESYLNQMILFFRRVNIPDNKMNNLKKQDTKGQRKSKAFVNLHSNF